ncbi:MAG TPA: monofunctional biosynthetic peptidoglycan transglycosylase [Bacteroidia bacterium]|nr:monofunctional biosynthetic peptidoglycan transglycosylase [Bacteroidia bacterium]
MKKLLLFSRRAVIFFCTFSFLLVLVYRWLPVSFTPLMFFREATCSAGVKHEWVPLEKISNQLQLAVVSTEDQNFLHHHGFDFGAIRTAMDEAEDGGRRRGGSTISQQTAKNVFLWPSSSFVRKGFEAWFTVLIELTWSKRRIMEVYLNSVEFGKGIYGCEAASEFFFRKHASALGQDEAARLAVVLPNPIRYNVAKPGAYMQKRKSWAISQMNNLGGKLLYGDEQDVKSRK